jgi:murein DD-endopeptidase MepM/ murein hydrolase activator NlpD
VSFSYAFEPILPPNLTQPKLLLPFEPGTVWSFTGGPHGGWGDGSAWAALDFAPPGEGGGCRKSGEWVVAMADGVITRSDLGAVVQDLDGDGDERTGWSILYMHIASADRVAAGSRLKAGERIGHPSCEGGVSNGTHTHIARRYNGEWIAADGSIPFNLEGWVSEGAGAEYYGYLKRNGQTLEAWDQKTDTNQIGR